MIRIAPATIGGLATLPAIFAIASARPLSGSTSLLERPAHASTLTAARPGDTIWVIINPVKADKRAQWEEFVRIFWGAGLQAKDSKTRASFTGTRVLFPTRANADGSFSYLFIMDPHISGNSYAIESLARQLLPEAEAARILGLMNDARSAPATSFAVTEATAAALGRK